MSEQLLKQILDEVKNINVKVDRLEVDLSNVKSDLSDVKVDLSDVKTDLKDFRTEVNISLQVIQTGQLETREEMTQRFNEINDKIGELQLDMDLTYLKTVFNEREIHRLKNKQ